MFELSWSSMEAIWKNLQNSIWNPEASSYHHPQQHGSCHLYYSRLHLLLPCLVELQNSYRRLVYSGCSTDSSVHLILHESKPGAKLPSHRLQGSPVLLWKKVASPSLSQMLGIPVLLHIPFCQEATERGTWWYLLPSSEMNGSLFGVLPVLLHVNGDHPY